MNDTEIINWILQELDRGLILNTEADRLSFECKIKVKRLSDSDRGCGCTEAVIAEADIECTCGQVKHIKVNATVPAGTRFSMQSIPMSTRGLKWEY